MRSRGTLALLVTLALVFAVEALRGTVGDEMALLALGALPNDGRLHHEYWRLVTYSALHLNVVHFVLNFALLWWVGQIVERRLGAKGMIAACLFAVIAAGVAITLTRMIHPKAGSTLGASGGICGLLACALVLLHRRDAEGFGATPTVKLWLWVGLAAALAASLMSGVSLAGHAAGAAAGALAGLVLPVNVPPNMQPARSSNRRPQVGAR